MSFLLIHDFKRMKTIYLILALLSCCLVCHSQNGISGHVYDQETGEALIGVLIRIDNGIGATTTDNNGYFYLRESSKDTIRISCVGYEKKKIAMDTLKNKQLNVYLKSGVLLDELIVTGNAFKQLPAGAMSLSTQQMKLIPNLTGETDVLKAFQLLPGVQGGSEGSVGLVVRGGTNDQNIYLLDDVPLYYVNHIGGFVSIFDASAIKNATLYKGFFPASFGGRLSSVMDIRLKDGDSFHSRKELMIGTLNSKFFCEGPFKNQKTTYLLSFRLCNLGLYTIFIDQLNYYFYDLNAKLSHRIDSNNKLLFTVYSGTDHFKAINDMKELDINSTNLYDFGNTMASIKWVRILNPSLTSNLTASYSNFQNINKMTSKFDKKNQMMDYNETLSSFVKEAQAKIDLSYLKYSNHAIRFGSVSAFQMFRPMVYSFKQEDKALNLDTAITKGINALQNSLYLEDKMEVNRIMQLTAGLRFSTFSPAHKKTYYNLEPRISTRILFKDRLSFNLGYSRMNQYVHFLSNNDGGFPKDLWVTSTEKVKPEMSDQYEIEANYKLSDHLFLKVDLYYKLLKGLIDYKENSSNFQNWEDNVESDGQGKNRGIELMITKEDGRLNGFISYVFSKSTRQFDGLNNGKEFPFKYDYRNQANIVLNYCVSKRMTFVATWTYHTGNAITLAKEKYRIIDGGAMEGSNGEVHVYNGRNGFRMPDYHRLDLGINFKNDRDEWHFGIYNAYNRMNPFYYYLSKKVDKYVLKQQTLFPFIPSISHTYYF